MYFGLSPYVLYYKYSPYVYTREINLNLYFLYILYGI